PRRSPATTAGTSTTTRPQVTCCCQLATLRRHQFPFKITWQPTRSNAQLLHPRSTRGPRGIVEQAEKSANTHVREAVPLLQPSGWPPNVDRHDRRDGPDLPERCLDHASTAAL